MEEWQLRNAWRNRQDRRPPAPLSEPMHWLVKQRLAKRVRQIGALSVIWDECIPDGLREHTALVRYHRGTLTVAVDSAPHRFQLQQLLAGGLQDAIRERFAGPINRIRLVPGPFDSLEMPERKRPTEG